MLAAAHWTGQAFPKFNTVQKKQELMNFAESIEENCGVPEVGFGKDGIAEHIQSYFNEQRRYQKRVSLMICSYVNPKFVHQSQNNSPQEITVVYHICFLLVGMFYL